MSRIDSAVAADRMVAADALSKGVLEEDEEEEQEDDQEESEEDDDEAEGYSEGEERNALRLPAGREIRFLIECHSPSLSFRSSPSEPFTSTPSSR